MADIATLKANTISNRSALARLPGIALVVSLAIACATASPAYATVLVASDTVASATGPDPVPGGNIVATLFSPMATKTFSGGLTTNVIDNDSTSPYGLSALTFTYQFSNTGPNSLSRFTISNFAGFATNVYYVAGADVAPYSMDRSFSDDVVGYSFVGPPLGGGKVIGGTSSVVLVIQTDATTYQPTLAAVIDGSTAEPPSYAPLTAVPEPSSIALACLGTLGLLGFAIRRRR